VVHAGTCLKPGHDGTAAIVRDRKLLYSIEAEKDSFGRYSALTPTAILPRSS
jgi:hydroxymethyl cephem carbamoyltransferase